MADQMVADEQPVPVQGREKRLPKPVRRVSGWTLLTLIIRKEITAHILSLRFAVTFALFFSLILVSTFVMTNEYRALVDQQSAAVASYTQALNEVKVIKDPQQQMDEIGRRGIIGNPATAMSPRPRLKVFDERISDSVNEALVDLVLMAIYNVLFFMGAYTLFLRYDVR